MTLRKIMIDNSVRYVKKSEKPSKQNQPISGGKPKTKKQNKNISQNSKKFLKNVAASGFGILK